MSKTLYYRVQFVTLHQKNPGYTIGNNQGNPYLTIGEFPTSTRKYGLEFGFGDPGENPNYDTYDYSEWAISEASFQKPLTYGTTDTYTKESGSGTTESTYSIWRVMSVPDNFLLPDGFKVPSVSDIIDAYISYGRSLMIDYAKSKNLPFANLADQMNKAGEIYKSVSTFQTTTMDLIGDAIAGRISADTLMNRSDDAALAMQVDLLGNVANVPAPLMLMVQNQVLSWSAKNGSPYDQVKVLFNSGLSLFDISPPSNPMIEIGSLGNDDLYDFGRKGDVVVGGLGNDTVWANVGNGILVGGAGTDTVDYLYAGGNLTIDLTKNTASNGSVFTDKLAGFENAAGGIGNDTIVGNVLANQLNGRNGNDTLNGGAGNDTLGGGGGTTDRLIGGTGSDTAWYYDGIYISMDKWAGITVSLENPAINTGDAAGDIYDSIENIWGTLYDDKLYGDAQANMLRGDNGADAIYGRTGNDTLIGGLGADRLYGESGVDTASYALASAGVTANLTTPSVNTGEAAGDSYSSIENLTGSRYADILTGNTGVNVISGGAGNDTLNGGAGNDTLIGGAGADKLYGEAGVDTASYAAATAGVTANLSKPSVNTGEGAGDSYSLIENLTGSRYADILTGNTGANVISGGAGNDTLDSGTGNDTLVGGAGADKLYGGSGTDTASYADAAAGVTANLGKASVNTGDAKGDVYSSVEYLIGSNYADILTGNDANNRVSGGSGNDRLNGGLGIDTLIGGAGADIFVFDTKLGKANIDTIDDFVAKDDTIWLDDDIFTKIGKVGDLVSSAFYAGTKAQDAADRIIYDKATGKLFYDYDGTGKGAAVQFALLDKGLTLTAADFDIIA